MTPVQEDLLKSSHEDANKLRVPLGVATSEDPKPALPVQIIPQLLLIADTIQIVRRKGVADHP